MSQDLGDVGYVISSTYRKSVAERLDESPATPSTIAEDMGEDIAHISRELTKLRDNDLVELRVPEDRKKGRLYGLTDAGQEAVDGAREIGELPPQAVADGGD